jgi:hypothetical protein
MKNDILTLNKHTLSMHKLVLGLVFLIFLTPLYSQKNRTYIGFDFYPTVTTQLNSSVDEPNIMRYSSNFGLSMHHEFLKRKLYFEYGIKHLNRGYGYKVDVVNFMGKKFGTYKYEKHNNYWSFPLFIGVKMKLFYFELGPSIDFLYSNRIFKSGKWMASSEPENTMNFSGNLAFGTMIRPKYMQNLLVNIGFYANMSLYQQYLNFGLKLGIKYRLKKKIKNYKRH